MGRNLLSYLIAVICSCTIYANTLEISITVQVQNAPTSTLYIQEAHLDQTQLTKTHRIDLTNGYAQFVYPVKGSGFVELLYNGARIPMYLDKLYAPVLSFDGQRVLETLQFSGKGSADNNFIADFNRMSGGTGTQVKECSYLDISFTALGESGSHTMSAAGYAAALEDRYQNQISLLSRLQSAISNEVYTFYKDKAQFEKESDKLIWLLNKQGYLNSSELHDAKTLLGLNIEGYRHGGYSISHPAYKNLLKAMAIWLYLPNDIHQVRAYTKIYQLIESQFSGEVKCFLASHLLVKVYEKSGETELGRSKIGELQNICPQFTDQIMQMYGGDISGVEDIAAADINMVDKKGSLVSLQDYKGKVVYISFWASWCKPCIAGFKKSADVRKKLQDMGVVLINISIDKKEEAWRDAMIRHNPLGINTWAISLQDLAKDYDISAIPLYHIINKQGKFAYLSDGGSRDIVEEFRTLVQQ